MATETPTREERWLSADELRRVAAVEPEAGPAPPPVHRTEERPSRWPLWLATAATLLALLAIVLVVV